MVIELFTEPIAIWLSNVFGAPIYMGIAFGLFVGGPLSLVALFFIGSAQRYGGRFGLFLGALVAAWCSACWLVIPYIGGYPNLPGAVIGLAFGMGTWGQEITIHATNFILWPLLGWLLFYSISLTERTVLGWASGRNAIL